MLTALALTKGPREFCIYYIHFKNVIFGKFIFVLVKTNWVIVTLIV